MLSIKFFYVSRFLTLRVESDDIPDKGIVLQLHISKKICCRTKMVNILPLPFPALIKKKKGQNQLLISVPSVDNSYCYMNSFPKGCQCVSGRNAFNYN